MRTICCSLSVVIVPRVNPGYFPKGHKQTSTRVLNHGQVQYGPWPFSTFLLHPFSFLTPRCTPLQHHQPPGSAVVACWGLAKHSSLQNPSMSQSVPYSICFCVSYSIIKGGQTGQEKASLQKVCNVSAAERGSAVHGGMGKGSLSQTKKSQKWTEVWHKENNCSHLLAGFVWNRTAEWCTTQPRQTLSWSLWHGRGTSRKGMQSLEMATEEGST